MPPPGPPLPGGPGFPPPHRPRGGGGALVLLLIAGFVGVIVVIGLGVFLLVGGDDDGPERRTALPSITDEPTYRSTTGPAPVPTRSSGGTSSDPASVLGPTIRTAKGNTFTRAGTRTQSCGSRANDRLLPTIRTYPCVGSMRSAVYADPAKKIITSVSIAEFSSPAAARAVSRATADKGWPRLLTPSRASGLAQPRPDPAYWTRSWSQGRYVVYAQSYWSHGGPTGGRDGSVFATAGELGAEVTNVLLWKN